MFLFHGSTAKAKQIYNSEEGIDLRFSGDSNLWGKGVYFSTAASYSNLYSKRSQMNSS